jgi:hypothetical protein
MTGDSICRVTGGKKTAYWTRDVRKSSNEFYQAFKDTLKTAGGLSQSTCNMLPQKGSLVNFELSTTTTFLSTNPVSINWFR